MPHDERFGFPTENGTEGTETSDATVARLAELSHVEYGKVRKPEAQRLGVPVEFLDRDVNRVRQRNGRTDTDHSLKLPEPELWPEPVDGDDLLDQLCRAFRQYIVIDEKHLHTLVLWAIHTHCIQHWQNTPRLHVSAPKKRSGKSRVLDVLEQVVARPLAADGLTAAVVFRLTEDHHPTLLADEIDQWLDVKGELIGILNSGHSKGKKAYRCVGDEHQVKEFDVFSPLALAGIGRIKSDTLADRAIKITIRRRLKSEPICRFRKDRASEFGPLQQQIARWVTDHKTDLAGHDPKIPDAIDNDRLIDNWLPLLTIADIAGGEWPDRARQIMLQHQIQDDVSEEDGWDILLLKDLKDIFDETGKDRLFTKEILSKLHLMSERPWPEYPNKRDPAKPITDRQMARLLEPHDIKPKLFKRPPDKPGRGYDRENFEDTWTRYVSPPGTPELSVTPLPSAETLGAAGNTYDVGNVTDNSSVTKKPTETLAGNGVTNKTLHSGDAAADAQLDIKDAMAATVEHEDRQATQNEPPLSSETREANRLLGEFPSQFDRRPSRMAKSST